MKNLNTTPGSSNPRGSNINKLTNQSHSEYDQASQSSSKDAESSQNSPDNPNKHNQHSNLFEKMENKINHFKNEAKDKFEETAEQVHNKSSEAQAFLSHYVKEHPLLSLGWALLAGAAIGVVLRK